MDISNFNTLDKEEKEKIFKELSFQYGEENISSFIVFTSSILNPREYLLASDFDVEQWNTFKHVFDNFNFSAKSMIIKKMIQDINKVNEIFNIFNKYNLCFNVSVGLVGGALRDLMLLDSPKIKDLDIVVSFHYNEEFHKRNFNFDFKNKGYS